MHIQILQKTNNWWERRGEWLLIFELLHSLGHQNKGDYRERNSLYIAYIFTLFQGIE